MPMLRSLGGRRLVRLSAASLGTLEQRGRLNVASAAASRSAAHRAAFKSSRAARLALSPAATRSPQWARKIACQCPTHARTGRCEENAKGACRYAHDPSNVAVCPAWLANRCSEPSCPLQHRRQPHLMPLCNFFLQGTCNNKDCPYLHKEHPAGATVCSAFLRGYCPLGAACRSRHLTASQLQQQGVQKPLPLRRKRTLTLMRAGAGATTLECGTAAGEGVPIVRARKRPRYFDPIEL